MLGTFVKGKPQRKKYFGKKSATVGYLEKNSLDSSSSDMKIFLEKRDTSLLTSIVMKNAC